MFHAMLVKLKQASKGSVTHKDPISKEDFLKIKSSSVLDVDTPAGLQNIMYLCRQFDIYICYLIHVLALIVVEVMTR